MLTWQWVVNWKIICDLWQVTNNLIACKLQYRISTWTVRFAPQGQNESDSFPFMFFCQVWIPDTPRRSLCHWICQLVGSDSEDNLQRRSQHEFNMLFGKVVFLVYLVVAEKWIYILMNLTQSSEHDGTAGKFYLTNSHRFRFQKRKKGAQAANVYKLHIVMSHLRLSLGFLVVSGQVADILYSRSYWSGWSIPETAILYIRLGNPLR